MRFSSFISLVVISLAFPSSAEPFPSPHNVHEKRAQPPAGWSLTRRLNGASPIPLRFALKQRSIEDIGKYLYDVSNPKSPRYGRHWTAGEIARTFAPSDETVDAVRSWLVASGIGEERIALGRTKGWMQVDATVEEAEQLMKTEYNVYTHISGKEHVACGVYHLPEHVQRHVDFVTPSVHFDVKLAGRHGDKSAFSARDIESPQLDVDPQVANMGSKIISELQECDKRITPVCLRMLYGFFYSPIATNKNSFGIVEYTPLAFLQSDLQMFARNYSTDLIGKKPYLVSIDGGIVQTTNQGFDFNLASDLHLQYGMSLVTGKQTVTLYQTGDVENGASFNNFLDAIDGSYCTFEGGDDPMQDSTYPDNRPGGYSGPEACGTVEPTYVIATTYEYNEADLTRFYAERQCAEYAKLGLMGITVFYSSGDRGVAGNAGLCLDSDGKSTADGWIFNPGFPATCPYVTTVGATMVKPNATVFDPEVPMHCSKSTYSSGGFSNYFAMPEYQKDVVDYYLTNFYPDHPSTIWNSTGTSRAIPDISANGKNYFTAVDGEFIPICGTSCSTPTVAAMFTMINDARLAVGKGPIGFINPTIYSAEFASAFNDITEGSNPGCNTTGYNATVGWDPVSGLGTPRFPELLGLWLSLP